MTKKQGKISGGTNPQRELTEHRLIIKFLYCEQYIEKDSTVSCASPEEFNKFFENASFELKIAHNYIDFSEPESE